MNKPLSRKHRTELSQGAYQDGIEDYCAGVPKQLCPYTRRYLKRNWLKGWGHMDDVAAQVGAVRVTYAHDAQALTLAA